jgi:hypothetical protein
VHCRHNCFSNIFKPRLIESRDTEPVWKTTYERKSQRICTKPHKWWLPIELWGGGGNMDGGRGQRRTSSQYHFLCFRFWTMIYKICKWTWRNDSIGKTKKSCVCLFLKFLLTSHSFRVKATIWPDSQSPSYLTLAALRPGGTSPYFPWFSSLPQCWCTWHMSISKGSTNSLLSESSECLNVTFSGNPPPSPQTKLACFDLSSDKACSLPSEHSSQVDLSIPVFDSYLSPSPHTRTHTCLPTLWGQGVGFDGCSLG